jgi:hypothetical protein
VEGCSFQEVAFYPSLGGLPDPVQPDFIVITAQKPV